MLKSVTTESGGLSVMTIGAYLMQTWCVVSLDMGQVIGEILEMLLYTSCILVLEFLFTEHQNNKLYRCQGLIQDFLLGGGGRGGGEVR